jgi:2-phosphosulfolactate phosphatase
VPHLLVGALLNARAVAAAVARLLAETDLSVTVLACGERWKEPNEDGELRFAIEDYLEARPTTGPDEGGRQPSGLPAM